MSLTSLRSQCKLHLKRFCQSCTKKTYSVGKCNGHCSKENIGQFSEVSLDKDFTLFLWQDDVSHIAAFVLDSVYWIGVHLKSLCPQVTNEQSCPVQLPGNKWLNLLGRLWRYHGTNVNFKLVRCGETRGMWRNLCKKKNDRETIEGEMLTRKQLTGVATYGSVNCWRTWANPQAYLSNTILVHPLILCPLKPTLICKESDKGRKIEQHFVL